MADCGCGAGLSASLWQGWKMGALGGAISGAGTGSALGGSFGSSGGPVGILVGGYVGSVIGSALGAAFGSVMGAAESWGGHILFSQCGCSPLCLCLPRDWRAPQATPTRRDPLVLDLNRDGKVELKNANARCVLNPDTLATPGFNGEQVRDRICGYQSSVYHRY